MCRFNWIQSKGWICLLRGQLASNVACTPAHNRSNLPCACARFTLFPPLELRPAVACCRRCLRLLTYASMLMLMMLMLMMLVYFKIHADKCPGVPVPAPKYLSSDENGAAVVRGKVYLINTFKSTSIQSAMRCGACCSSKKLVEHTFAGERRIEHVM